MPVFGDATFVKFSDGLLTVNLVPPVSLQGMTVQLTISKRFGSVAPIVVRNMASGFYGYVSGMDIANSGAGIFSARVFAADLSGYDPGNFACQVKRMDSGFQNALFQGYVNLTPGNV